MLVLLSATTADYIKMLPLRRRLDGKQTLVEFWSTSQQPRDLEQAASKSGYPIDFWISRGPQAQNLSSRSQVPVWLSGLTWKVMRNSEQLRKRIQSGMGSPALVVHGDTMSAAWGIFLARRLGVDLVHVEAGLRSGSILDPFPEELSRRLVGRFARVHYAPDARAAANLARHGGDVVTTFGNTVIDSIRDVGAEARHDDYPAPYAIISLHRSELLSNKAVLDRTIHELVKLAHEVPLLMIVDSLALEAFRRHGSLALLDQSPNIELLGKVPHGDFLRLLLGAAFVVTDSGGLQEECAHLGIPCLVHRRSTERGDGLGTNARLSYWRAGSLLEFHLEFDGLRQTRQDWSHSPSDVVVADLVERGYVVS